MEKNLVVVRKKRQTLTGSSRIDGYLDFSVSFGMPRQRGKRKDSWLGIGNDLSFHHKGGTF